MDTEHLTVDFNLLNDISRLQGTHETVKIAAVIMNNDDAGYFINLFDRQSLLFFLKHFNICFENDL